MRLLYLGESIHVTEIVRADRFRDKFQHPDDGLTGLQLETASKIWQNMFIYTDLTTAAEILIQLAKKGFYVLDADRWQFTARLDTDPIQNGYRDKYSFDENFQKVNVN